jgi:hypothetical protein
MLSRGGYSLQLARVPPEVWTALWRSNKNYKKYTYFFSFFAHYLHTVAPFTPVFKDNKPLRSTKQLKSRFFLNFIAWPMEGSGSVQIITDPDPGGPKSYGSQFAPLV